MSIILKHGCSKRRRKSKNNVVICTTLILFAQRRPRRFLYGLQEKFLRSNLENVFWYKIRHVLKKFCLIQSAHSIFLSIKRNVYLDLQCTSHYQQLQHSTFFWTSPILPLRTTEMSWICCFVKGIKMAISKRIPWHSRHHQDFLIYFFFNLKIF